MRMTVWRFAVFHKTPQLIFGYVSLRSKNFVEIWCFLCSPQKNSPALPPLLGIKCCVFWYLVILL